MNVCVCIHAPPCFGRSSKGKTHVNPHVKSQESPSIDPEKKHVKYSKIHLLRLFIFGIDAQKWWNKKHPKTHTRRSCWPTRGGQSPVRIFLFNRPILVWSTIWMVSVCSRVWANVFVHLLSFCQLSVYPIPKKTERICRIYSRTVTIRSSPYHFRSDHFTAAV